MTRRTRLRPAIVAAFLLFGAAAVLLFRRDAALAMAYRESQETISKLRLSVISMAQLKPIIAPNRASLLGIATGTSCAATAGASPCSSELPRPAEISVDAAATSALRAKLGAKPSSYLLVVMFSPTDCTLCLQEAKVWQRLYEQTPETQGLGVSIAGILDRSTAEEGSSVAQAFGLTFPLFLDERSALRETLGIRETPFKLLVHPDGHVVFTDAANRGAPEQQAFEARVRAALGGAAVP